MSDSANHPPLQNQPPIWRLIAQAQDLVDGGLGIRFELPGQPHAIPAFAVRFDGQAYAYLNQCAHVAMEMDWQAGQFFDLDQRYLMCATHGALYEPDSGLCVAGPCTGQHLKPITLKEENGHIYVNA